MSLPKEVEQILSALHGTSADWRLTRRNGKLSMQIRWPSDETTNTTTIDQQQRSRKRTSKARTDRNNRRLQAFLLKKSGVNNDANTTEEQDSAAPQSEIDEMDTPELSFPSFSCTPPTPGKTMEVASQDSPVMTDRGIDPLPPVPLFTEEAKTKMDSSCDIPSKTVTNVYYHQHQGVLVFKTDKDEFVMARKDGPQILPHVITKSDNTHNLLDNDVRYWPDIRLPTSMHYSKEMHENIKKIKELYHLKMWT